MKNKIRTLIQISLLLILSGAAMSPVAGASGFPERIILNPTTDPAHEQAVTWRSLVKLDDPTVQVSLARKGADLEVFDRDFPAKSEEVSRADEDPVWHYSAVLKGLLAGTKYYYRVGSEKSWSEWIGFTTAEESFEPFTFVYMGDPQVGLLSYCSRLFRQAIRSAPDARFWLFAGDQVNDGNSDQDFYEFFYAGGWMFRSLNILPVAGNHEYPRSESGETRSLTYLWRPHYTLPENGPAGLEETSYWLDYQGVRIIVLNGNENVLEQRDWLEEVLRKDGAKWTIVSIHQPLYSTGNDRDNPELQMLFLPLFDEYGVDLVLQGHDHTYGRTYPLRNGKIVTGGNEGTVYLVSSSGAKFYRQNPRYLGLMAKTALETQLFQVLDVEENAIHFKAINTNGELVDQFTLIKK